MYGDSLYLETQNYKIVLRDESIYTPNSADNKYSFDKELFLDESEEYISSKHSVVINSRSAKTYSCILLAGGGASGIHQNSAIAHDEKLLVAVGNFVCCLLLPELEIVWRTKVDWATCFGIYHSTKHKCYISHGEIEVSRLNYQGEICWQASGKDIFTGNFILHDDFIEVIDFNEESYQIDIETGVCNLSKIEK